MSRSPLPSRPPDRRAPTPRRPGTAPGPDPVLPGAREALSLLAPLAGAVLGWWAGSEFGGVFTALIGGLAGTGLGLGVARRMAADLLS